MMNRFVTTTGRMILMTMTCVAVLLAAGCGKPSPTQVAEGIVDSMAKGDFASATKDFDPTMKTALPAERLSQAWSQVTALAGAFKSRAGSREAQEAGFQTVHVTCQFEKATMDTKVVFDTDGKIGGLWINPAQPAKPK